MIYCHTWTWATGESPSGSSMTIIVIFSVGQVKRCTTAAGESVPTRVKQKLILLLMYRRYLDTWIPNSLFKMMKNSLPQPCILFGIILKISNIWTCHNGGSIKTKLIQKKFKHVPWTLSQNPTLIFFEYVLTKRTDNQNEHHMYNKKKVGGMWWLLADAKNHGRQLQRWVRFSTARSLH